MMKDAVRRLNVEYGLNLTEEEVDQIVVTSSVSMPRLLRTAMAS
ncbi:MAG: hypothetical protein ACREQ7_12150 [Candidatus Binatia bacterium]